MMSNRMLASALLSAGTWDNRPISDASLRRRSLQAVNQNLRTFQDATEESGGSLPRYVWQEFERYLACGDFLRGLARFIAVVRV